MHPPPFGALRSAAATIRTVPLTPSERAAWEALLALRPHLEAGHDPACSGVTDLLSVTPETCQECREWLAEVLREERRLEAEGRKPRA